MTEDLKPNEAGQETAVSRREFGAVSLAAGLAAVAGVPAAGAAERPLTETDVTVKTPDGNCDAVFIHPTAGTYPGRAHLAGCLRVAPRYAPNRTEDRVGRLCRCSSRTRFTGPRKRRYSTTPPAFDFDNPADTGEAAAADRSAQCRGRGGEGRDRLCRVSRCPEGS